MSVAKAEANERLTGEAGIAPGRVVEVVVYRSAGQRLLVRLRSTELPRAIRCRFPAGGDHSVLAMTHVARSAIFGDWSKVELITSALHCLNREPLVAFLERWFPEAPMADAHFFDTGSGIVYAFDPSMVQISDSTGDEPTGADTGAEQPDTEDLANTEKRWRPRYAIDVPVTAHRGSEAVPAILLDVGSEGARLCTPIEIGGEVQLVMPLEVGRIPREVRAHATVKWNQTDDEDRVLSGVQIDKIEDGANGRYWERFIAQCDNGGDRLPGTQRGRTLTKAS